MTTATGLTATRPWGASRLAPYPTTVRLPHAAVEVDPDTQLGVFRDCHGQVVEMGKHGTGTGTETNVTTSSDNQTGNDQGKDQENDQD
ncbi:putative ATP-grasp-modified RiPP [Streptomyces sp. LX-29]|uniref:putative ATP-grasp-modified RiPP n=1 Tax=Streptomyces sp. LX-29 TaxID=2900152 RepID=UPI00240E2738|nr:putative ATP-grasp-modified RiPP [Streptomyces sp. LX-29]WFB11513.1 putative ATP-grasp-modified RiPP [Streptomyces sp. LX-29]WFB11811.1 putative ATP-grasp-modified RiPP [Streptomyces sp. LX-29]